MIRKRIELVRDENGRLTGLNTIERPVTDAEIALDGAYEQIEAAAAQPHIRRARCRFL